MQALSSRIIVMAAGAAMVLVVVSAGGAAAKRGTGTVHGGKQGETIDASAFNVTYEPKSPPPGNPIRAVTGWTPPPCWQAPVATPQQLKAERESVWAESSTGYQWVAGQQDYYVKGHPHTNFEIADADKGYWWNGQVNPNRLADPASLSCFKERDDWVLKGGAPPAGPVVTPEVLAESAYDRIRIPDKVVTLSPDALHTQTVNLDIWAWLDRGDVPPVSVTARLRSLGIWATTTATPAGLHLETDTPYADFYPASGDCPLNVDGSIGRKYLPGDGNAVPPCGLTYRKSSGQGTYTLTATITWKVTWKGSGGTGGTLDNGVFDEERPVTVQEIQTVNR